MFTLTVPFILDCRGWQRWKASKGGKGRRHDSVVPSVWNWTPNFIVDMYLYVYVCVCVCVCVFVCFGGEACERASQAGT